MRNIDTYCDEAIKHNGLKSDSELARKLGFTSPAVSNFRTKRAWPSDQVMVRLADLAGIPAEEALLELKIWRNYDTPAGKVYMRILSTIKQCPEVSECERRKP